MVERATGGPSWALRFAFPGVEAAGWLVWAVFCTLCAAVFCFAALGDFFVDCDGVNASGTVGCERLAALPGVFLVR